VLEHNMEAAPGVGVGVAVCEMSGNTNVQAKYT
jgi:hypothetical protein